jgi:hypothetical protein
VTERSQETQCSFMKTKIELELKYDEFGWPYCNELPEGFKIAKMDDFYDDENSLIVGKAFLVESYKYSGRYWAYRVQKSFPYVETDFVEFMTQRRVWLYR